MHVVRAYIALWRVVRRLRGWGARAEEAVHGATRPPSGRLRQPSDAVARTLIIPR
ncbi:hypothetical protein GCM10027168_42240 [Streptomyces capparidis]